jgi:putative membrane protein
MDTGERTHRDHLAKQRTHLANERTFLAYMRTAASFIVLGVALVRFLEDNLSKTLGWLSLVFGISILVYGLWRFRQRRHQIQAN